MKNSKLSLVLLLAASCGANAATDMSDPTAVYSSVGVNYSFDYGDSEELESHNVDVSVGFGWSNNMLSLETKSNAEAINARYAKMNILGSLGLYTDITYNEKDINLNNESAYTLSVGGVYSLRLNETFQFYPVATVGFAGITDTEGEAPILYTLGSYNRVQLGHGFSLGLDPFYTMVDGTEYDALKVDTFVSYQVNNHQFRLGAEASWDSESSYDDKEDQGLAYLKYKFAF